MIKLREAITSMHNGIYLERENCFPECGSIGLCIVNADYNSVLEEYIEEISTEK